MLKEQINCAWNIEWYNVNSISPTEEQVKRHEGEFLCYAIYPDDNGKAKSTYVIVSYNYKSKNGIYLIIFYCIGPNCQILILLYFNKII